MVEVNPSKGEIAIRSGWIIFTVIALVVFGLLFYFIPNTGWNWWALGIAVGITIAIDVWAFHAPAIAMVALLIAIGLGSVAAYFLN